MVKQGITRPTVMAKLCLSEAGVPISVQIMKSSGYPEADSKIKNEMEQWRYRPYMVNGRAVPTCTAVTFNYVIGGG